MYDIGRALTLLDSILGVHHAYAKQEYYYFCPFCNHYNPKLAVNLEKKAWHCWKCGKKGRSLRTLLRELHASREDIRELSDILGDSYVFKAEGSTDALPPFVLPAEYLPLTKWNDAIEYRHAINYLKQRHIGMDEIRRYQIGFCLSGRYRNRIIVPSYNADGSLNYFVARSFYDPTDFKYMNPPTSKNVVAFENEINWRYPIILTEGVFDAMAVKRNAIPLLGTHIPKKLQEKIIHVGVKEIYLALDRDALKATLAIADNLMKQGVAVYVVQLDDKDPSKLGFEHTHDLIRSARKLTFASLIQLKLTLV